MTRPFLDACPEIELRVDGTNEPTDFTRELVDVEIHGDGRWPGLFVEGLVEETFLPACKPDYAREASLAAPEFIKYRLMQSVKSQAIGPDG